MTTHLSAKPSHPIAALALAVAAFCITGASASALAQTFPISATQQQTANDVAQKGVPLADLAANAPDRYTVVRGDTLWAISTLFLKGPWRWPELWGMNLSDIKNPHLIYPGQMLVLERRNGLATLTVRGVDGITESEEPQSDALRVSPKTRYSSLQGDALTTLKSKSIDPFLLEPLVVGDEGLRNAPQIVASIEGRVLLTRGDRAYVRGPTGSPVLDDQPQRKRFRLFRDTTPLKDPGTGEVLGYEAQYAGTAVLVKPESFGEIQSKDGVRSNAIVPATIDIVSAKGEILKGYRLLPEPPRELRTYTPHAPSTEVSARIVAMYGSNAVNATQNQVVSINRGERDGMESGMVLAILKDGERVTDKLDPARPLMKLPNERNGLMMVFRVFERVSYGLVLEATDSVSVGDRLVNPR